MTQDFDVIICGGGPVGMGLAIDLGQRGHRVAVVERYPEPQPIPKGQNLTQRSMENIHSWGAEKELRAARTVPPGAGIGGLTCYGALLSDYHYDWLIRAKVRPFYFTDNERLPQYATERVLRARAAQIPAITTYYGWDGGAVTDAGDHVMLEVSERGGSSRQVLKGRYLVGCDGSRSRIREQAGITETLRDHDRLMVLAVFDAPKLHDYLERYPGKVYYNVLRPDLEGYWLFFGRVDLEGRFFFHAPVPLGTTRDNFDFKGYIQKAAGAEFDIDFDYLGFWELRIAIADSYGKGNIFIAGDAAHSHPPYGGYGVNTGFEDARNLGWKLSAMLEGWGGAGLLDSYTQERRPVFASTAEGFIEKAIEEDRKFLKTYAPDEDLAAFEAAWQERIDGTTDEVFSFEPNYRGSPIVVHDGGGQPSAVGNHEFRARAGHHLAPKPLSDGRNVFEALGPGFTLIALSPKADIAGYRNAAKALGVPLTVIEDSAAGGREEWEADMILLRPDQFVAWCGENDATPEIVMRRATGHLA
jgi:2-polyprenyl-6-methoxyphenol hydroxylase-like FAD-dependent oxidoreductase